VSAWRWRRPFGEADQRGQRAVDIDVEGRLLKSLLDARIGDAGIALIFVNSESAYLRFAADRCRPPAGRSEPARRIEDLADDISRKKGKTGAGKLLGSFSRMVLM